MGIARPLLDSLPIHLRLLSVAHLSLSSAKIGQITRLPQLDTLLFTDAQFMPESFDLFKFPTCRFRVLGLTKPGIQFGGDLLANLSHTIRHVVLACSNAHGYAYFGHRIHNVQPTLRSLEIVARPFTDTNAAAITHGVEEKITSACSRAGVTLKIVHCASDDEADAFDLEEWAASAAHA